MVKTTKSLQFFNTRKSPKSLPNTQKALVMFYYVIKFNVVLLSWPNRSPRLVSPQIWNFLILSLMRPIWRRLWDSIRHGWKFYILRLSFYIGFAYTSHMFYICFLCVTCFTYFWIFYMRFIYYTVNIRRMKT